MLELLKQRRSVRKFTDEAITPEEVKALLSAALLTPSGKNKKPLEFVVVQQKDKIHELQMLKSRGSQPMETAPLAVVVIADLKRSDTWIEEAGAATILMQLEAVKLGLASCWIQLRLRDGEEGSCEAAYRKHLGIPDHYGVMNVIAFGHADEEKKPYTDAVLDFGKVHNERF